MDLHDLKPPVRLQDRFGYIYHTIFTRPTDGRQFHYIGQHKAAKLDRRYVGSGIRLRHLCEKYGRHRTLYTTIVCWSTSREELNSKELHFIAEARRLWRKDCINLEHWGSPGTRHESTRIKIGNAHRGKHVSQETRAKLSAAHMGKVISSATRRKISETSKGRLVTTDTRAKLSRALSGRSKSMEHRVAISRAKAGIAAYRPGWSHTDETRARLSRARLGKKLSESTRAAIAAGKRGKPHPQPQVTCPHCGLVGAKNGLTRYHFDNCKLR